MLMDKITHEVRLSQWTSIIEECAQSGLPKTKWCTENNVDIKQFFYWQRKVREEVYNEIKTKSLPVTTFAELSVPPVQAVIPNVDTGAAIRFNDVVIEINNNCSVELLQTILTVSAHAK